MTTFDCPLCYPVVTYWSKDLGPHVCDDCGSELTERKDSAMPYDFSNTPPHVPDDPTDRAPAPRVVPSQMEQTSQETNMKEDEALIHMLGSMAMGTDAYIRHTEKVGQVELVNSEVLPKDMGSRVTFEKTGIVFHDDVDDLFVRVTLPAGWKKIPTSHSMWSDLVDDKGRRRAGIFYKAAFYDRSAHMHAVRRYSYGSEPVGGWEDKKKDCMWHCVVSDCQNVIWSSDAIGPEPDYNDKEKYFAWLDKKDGLSKLGEAWLKEHFPNFSDETAYWEQSQ